MPHRLLLADDSVTIQRVIELTFADEDVQVTAVGDGQAAIDCIREEPPDIVLTDVTMPERDGYEVAAFIKEDPALAHIPVVLLTGAYEPVDEARAKAIGCDGIMVKPFEPQMVINRVRELLEGKRPASLWTASLDQQDAVGIDTAEGAPAPEPGAAGSALAAALATAGTNASEVSSTSSEGLDTYVGRLAGELGTLGDQPPTAAVESAVPVETPVEPIEAAPSAVESATLESGIAPPAQAVGPGPPPAPEPGAAGPALAATGRDASEVSSTSRESLDTYFDQLNDALGTLGDQPPTAAVESAVPVETPVEPKAAPSAVESPTLESGIAPPAQPVSPGPPSAAGVSLAEMFSALLAAEQQWSAPPDTPGGRAAASLATERLVADITRRVLDQVTDQAVRDTVSRAVSQVAERLVREEIEHIKVMADAEEDASQQP